jgi:8-oxo-dGTP pyrophosphatase MutT (NUDIX family)
MATTTDTPPFTFSPSLVAYNTSPARYLSAHPALTNLVVSALIVHNDRVLLIQRAPHDGFPLKWECPGGGVDMADATILHALCREVREETSLLMHRVTDVVDVLEFDGSEETRWRKITFLVLLEGEDAPPVRLNAEEHVDGVWASQGDVLSGRCEGREIDFAYQAQRQTVLDVLTLVRRATT